MAYYSGTNIDYQAEDFLDMRQGEAKSKNDLKNWDKPVPKSFKTCLDGKWYYWNPEIDLPETGHWVPETVDTVEEAVDPSVQAVTATLAQNLSDKVANVEESIGDLDNTMYPTSIQNFKIGPAYASVAQIQDAKDEMVAAISNNIYSQLPYEARLDWNGDGRVSTEDRAVCESFYESVKTSNLGTGTSNTYWLELGDKILPKFTWKVVRPLVTWTLSGTTVSWSLVPGTENNTVSVRNSIVNSPVRGEVGEDLLSWTGREILTSRDAAIYTFSVTSEVKETIRPTASGTIRFGYRLYYGAWDSSIQSLSTINPATYGFTKEFCSSGAMSNKTFNCSGGKYPYILIPTAYFSASRKTYVSNNLNSDFTIKDVTVVNSMGVSIPYKLYYTNYEQNGSAIAIKIE